MSTAPASLGAPPAGKEWRRADELRVGDVLDATTIDGVPVSLVIETLELKPATVYITVAASMFGITQRQRIRPRHDDYFPVPPRREVDR